VPHAQRELVLLGIFIGAAQDIVARSGVGVGPELGAGERARILLSRRVARVEPLTT
jgi:hypothetical protein